MITDLDVYEIGDAILLTTAGDTKAMLLSRLDQLIFSEDVQLGDVTDTFAQVAIIGPEAAAVTSRVLGDADAGVLAGLPEHGNRRASWEGEPAIVTRVTDAGEAGFDVFVDRAKSRQFIRAIGDAGAAPLDAGTAEAIRVEAGVPLFHRDMDEQTIPLEAGIESRAISFSKGCYVGQEVVIRVLHRGHGRVAKKLAGLVLDGNGLPGAGAIVRAADRDIGHVTSSVFSPALQTPIALAYLHRDFLAPGTMVSVEGVRAVVAALPFVSR